MSNRTEMRARLRQELGDTAPSATIWSDTLLDSLLVEACGWYSLLWPRQAEVYRDVEAGQRAFLLPEGALALSGVECPPGKPLPQEATPLVGEPSAHDGVRQGWTLWGSTCYLSRGAAGDEVGTGRLVMRVLTPWERPDPVEPWNGPEGDESLLVLWAAAEAWAWLDGQERKRGRLGNSGPNSPTARAAARLELAVSARRRAVSSRRLEVG